MTAAAEASDTSCSLERPPNTIPTRTRFTESPMTDVEKDGGRWR